MKTICLIGIALLVILYITNITIGFIGGLTIGYEGYPDVWENEKCEKISDIISVVELILTAILFILAIIITITH